MQGIVLGIVNNLTLRGLTSKVFDDKKKENIEDIQWFRTGTSSRKTPPFVLHDVLGKQVYFVNFLFDGSTPVFSMRTADDMLVEENGEEGRDVRRSAFLDMEKDNVGFEATPLVGTDGRPEEDEEEQPAEQPAEKPAEQRQPVPQSAADLRLPTERKVAAVAAAAAAMEIRGNERRAKNAELARFGSMTPKQRDLEEQRESKRNMDRNAQMARDDIERSQERLRETNTQLKQIERNIADLEFVTGIQDLLGDVTGAPMRDSDSPSRTELILRAHLGGRVKKWFRDRDKMVPHTGDIVASLVRIAESGFL